MRWFHVAVPLGCLGVAVLGWALLRERRQVVAAPRPGPVPAASPVGVEPSPAAIPKRRITLFWPSSDRGGLVRREGDVFATASVVDQAKQVVDRMLAGPTERALAAPLPEGTRLRALFIDRQGTAYVDLSGEAISRAPGGSTWEQLAVYSLVNTLTRSFPDVRRVQILVDGQEIETLNGHLDLRRPLEFADVVAVEP